MLLRALRVFAAASILSASNSAAQVGAAPGSTNAPPANAIPSPAATAFEELKRQAATGDADAEQKLGLAYYNGQGVAKDDAQAFAWCLKAASQGQLKAEYNVAYLYEYGQGVTRDLVLSFQWYLKTANRGVPAGELAVANAYLYGNGVGIDPIQAAAWYRKAAIQGNADAQVRYGVICLHDKQNPATRTTGFAYLLRNSPGNAYAAFWVACCYRDGLVAAKNPVQAYAWFLYASRLPPTSITKDLPNAASLVKASLTAEQIGHAQQELGDLTSFLAGRIQPSDLASAFATGNSAVVPFEFVNNAILIPVPARDGKPAYLMFDTGCDMSCLSDRFAAAMGVSGNTYIPLNGIGENIALSTISDKTAFSIPGLTFSKTRWALVPGFNFDAEFGKPIVGVLGLDLVMSFVVRIDFAKHVMELTKPADFQPPTGSVCLPLTVTNLRPSVEATVASGPAEVKTNFLIDTGDSGSFDLTKVFADRNPSLKFKILTASAATGFGGTIYTDRVVCPMLRLGEISFPDVPADLDRSIQGLEADINGKIGTDLWRRLDVAFDFPDRKLYLQKNGQFADPYPHVGAGMHVMASGDNYETLTIHEILPDSVAAKAGFQTGDVLVKVDELGDSPLSLPTFYPLLHRVGLWHCHVQRSGQLIMVPLELKDTTVSDNPVTPSK